VKVIFKFSAHERTFWSARRSGDHFDGAIHFRWVRNALVAENANLRKDRAGTDRIRCVSAFRHHRVIVVIAREDNRLPDAHAQATRRIENQGVVPHNRAAGGVVGSVDEGKTAIDVAGLGRLSTTARRRFAAASFRGFPAGAALAAGRFTALAVPRYDERGSRVASGPMFTRRGAAGGGRRAASRAFVARVVSSSC
jgi:hypothetical protein